MFGYLSPFPLPCGLDNSGWTSHVKQMAADVGLRFTQSPIGPRRSPGKWVTQVEVSHLCLIFFGPVCYREGKSMEKLRIATLFPVLRSKKCGKEIILTGAYPKSFDNEERIS
jgi:hypothetical protein